MKEKDWKVEFAAAPEGKVKGAQCIGETKVESLFKFGEEYDEPTFTGDICKTIITKVSDTEWHAVSKAANYSCVGSLKVSGDKLECIFDIGGIKVKSICK